MSILVLCLFWKQFSARKGVFDRIQETTVPSNLSVYSWLDLVYASP